VAERPSGRGGQSSRPVIVVLTGGAGPAVREVLAGVEEEGVPSSAQSVAEADRGIAAAELAVRAAMQSPLQVGVGVSAAGEICVCHAKLAQPVFELPAGSPDAAARTMGHNAARIVAGLPLKALTDREIGHV
jgi:Dehydratase medium subunit